MKEILEKRIRNKSLSKDEAKHTLLEIGQGKCNSHQIAAFLTTYMMRVVTIEELSGFRAALLDLCIAIDLKDYDPIDLCGTGGDGKDTFNISTLASFVTAGAGVAVAKHGNYGVSSSCGSSNVMEHLGIRFSNDQDFLRPSGARANPGLAVEGRGLHGGGTVVGACFRAHPASPCPNTRGRRRYGAVSFVPVL